MAETTRERTLVAFLEQVLLIAHCHRCGRADVPGLVADIGDGYRRLCLACVAPYCDPPVELSDGGGAWFRIGDPDAAAPWQAGPFT